MNQPINILFFNQVKRLIEIKISVFKSNLAKRAAKQGYSNPYNKIKTAVTHKS